MKTGLYRGFSSHNYQTKRSFSEMDISLVELDILSQIYTKKGSRVMMPTWGSRIPSLAFEPLDSFTLTILQEDLQTVIAADPRVKLQNLTITPNYDTNTVVASVLLYYVELNITKGMDINISFETA